MRYLGSKARLFKHIGPIIQGYIDDTGFNYYIEPFCGGCNVIDKIKAKKRIAMDSNEYLISMWQALQKGWHPPDFITREEYESLRVFYKEIKSGKITVSIDLFQSALIGFAGIACAFSGSWYAGYSESGNRNRCLETKRAVLKQIDNMQDVSFYPDDCRLADTMTGEKSVIYLDPPYAGIELYPGAKKKISAEQFWDWAKELADNGNIVLVSEYTAPENITTLLWEQDVSVHAHQTNTKKAKEKLFLVRG